MCGITGFISFDERALGQKFLDDAAQVIFHRGPDEGGSAIVADGKVGLAMRRLSIVDLAGGHQPMNCANGDVTIVFNGEIYNYPELKAKYLPDEEMSTRSDTEVLLKLYERMGTACFSLLRGMFGVAIWDARVGKLILARDVFGKKPLYYFKNDKVLVFGSEIKSVLQDDGVPRKLSQQGFDNFLTWLAVPDPETMFEGIRKLPAAHVMEVELDGTNRISRYWDLRFPGVPEIANASDAADLMLSRLSESISLRLRADVPVGVLLSGGVDSSAIVALASRQVSHHLRTYSIGFSEEGFNEFQYSDAVAKRYGTDHTKIIMPPELYWDTLQTVIWHLDEPVCDTATVPLFYLCREARKSVKVLLSGEGSDEMLGGYTSRYKEGVEVIRRGRAAEYLPGKIRSYLWNKAGGGVWPKSRKELWNLTQPGELRFLNDQIYGYYEGLREDLYSGGPMEGFHPDRLELASRVVRPSATPLQRLLYTDCNVNLPAYLLMKADKMSMAASIELRCPFLDREFADFCAGLPDELKLDQQVGGKAILKKALEPLLPHDVLYRPKMGFPVPIGAWLKGGLKEQAYETLFNSNSRISQFLNIGHVRSMWDHHQRGTLVFGTQLWQLVLVELWMTRFGVTV
ncbi:asparagine synthase (glutamine-hydrolyzing) [Dyella flagellata]|uniref:asparagine synthase (glutamine-hydrolyzing) n=1 Tax=Dyella flagellata TaxID=1867833 RepID=A0ABQ5X906_9GAMM|nr:asparagine synthase (glutamine-hydrolyzing) [Dyella flagellata]GLQ88083.1 asparagine synthetase B [Dyella flagellata]